MPTFAQTLRQEIKRMVQQENRALVKVLTDENRKLRKAVDQLEQAVGSLASGKASHTAQENAREIAQGASPVSFSSDSLREFRHGLGLSQREIAALCGVSSQAVYLWECKGGKLRLRNETRRRLLAIQKMSKAQIKDALAKAYE